MTNKTQKRSANAVLQSIVAQLSNIIKKVGDKKQGQLVQNLGAYLHDNPRDANSLITVDTHLEPKKTKYDNVPIVCIILKFVDDPKLTHKFIDEFVAAGGDLELESKTHKLTALSVAREHRKYATSDYIETIIKNQYSSLPDKPNEMRMFQEFQKNHTVRKSSSSSSYYTPRSRSRSRSDRRPPPPIAPKSKSVEPNLEINLSETVPSKYDPEFWNPIIGDDVINTLRTVSCDKLTELFNGYKKYDCIRINRDGERYGTYSPDDCETINRIMCITFLCLGVLSHRLRNSDYTIVFKGGKVIQMMYPKSEYKSDDIDVVLVSKRGYNHEQMKSFACHIGYLLAHISSSIMEMSVLKPKQEEDKFNDIVKISINHLGYIPICDIDFSNSPNYLTNIRPTKKNTKWELATLFRHPSEQAMLDDKLKWFIHYEDLKFKQQPKTTEHDYYIAKFKRAISAILSNAKNKDENRIMNYVKSNFPNDEFVIGVAGHTQIANKIGKMLSLTTQAK